MRPLPHSAFIILHSAFDSHQPAPQRRRHQDRADDQHPEDRALLVVLGARQHVLDVVDEAGGLVAGAGLEAGLAVDGLADDGDRVGLEEVAAPDAHAALDHALLLLVVAGAVGAPVGAVVVLHALLAGDVGAALAADLRPRGGGARHGGLAPVRSAPAREPRGAAVRWGGGGRGVSALF